MDMTNLDRIQLKAVQLDARDRGLDLDVRDLMEQGLSGSDFVAAVEARFEALCKEQDQNVG